MVPLRLEHNAWRDRELECSVCGLPFRSRGWILEDRLIPLPPEFDSVGGMATLKKNEQWLDDVVLLCDPEDEMGQLIPSFTYENLINVTSLRTMSHPSTLPLYEPMAEPSSIEEHAAEHLGGPYFYLRKPDGTELPVDIHHWDVSTFDGRSYIPIHGACLNLAKRVINCSSSSRHLSSMRSLFIALRWRHVISQPLSASEPDANYMLSSPRWYRPYGEFWECGAYYEEEMGKTKWPGPTQDSIFNLLHTFLSDPLSDEDPTATLLRNLKPCRRDKLGDDDRRLQTNLAALPDDVFNIILSHLRSFRDLPRRTTHALPQGFWTNELIQGGKGLLPWLWDINTEKVHSKSHEPCPGGGELEWDWELLVRQLSRSVDGGIRPDIPENMDVYSLSDDTGVFQYEERWTYRGYDNDLRYVPRGLHTRRRIWQLLEEMFVGDQLPVAGQCANASNLSETLRPRQECVQLPWAQDGTLRKSAIWLPTLNLGNAFARKIGGHVYNITSRKLPVQCWQTEESVKEKGADGEEPRKGASVAEIMEMLRKLGYPA
ncbi:hypothetical protein F4778DRAFT_72266 [Xylariomycetidae sp. FL2044]|nr:hypothetical protein F4778DRAFT_72266 [Xylariomycetidae sp. FL2044]